MIIKFMNLVNKKKSQASILAVVLIILIILVLIVLVWNVVIPLIRERSEEVNLNVVTTSLEIKEVVLMVTGASEITIVRDARDSQIDKLKFIFYDESGKSYIFEKSDFPKPLEKKTYKFSPPLNIGKIEKVSVVPVFGKNLGRESSLTVKDIFEVPLSLISWWRFDNGDDFISDNHCENVIVEESDRGGVSMFSGLGVSCGNIPVDSEMSVSFWIKTLDEDAVLIENGACKIKLKEGKINFEFNEILEGVNYVSDDEWHYVTVTLGGIYIDGALDVSVILSDSFCDGGITFGESFLGNLDEVMFFNKSLEKSQVEYLFNSQ